MKFFRRPSTIALSALGILCLALAAWASMPAWVQGIASRSVLESAMFRNVPLLGDQVTIRRPPAETVPALSELIQSQPHPEELYSLRAMEEEQALDFKAAEADWKLYLQNSPAKAAAELALADFYHRRHHPLDEVNALSDLGRMPATPAEKFTALVDQQSWKAFERIFQVIQSQALDKTVSIAQYKAWIQRYPQEQAVYSRYFEFLLAQKNFVAAQQLVVSYQRSFPQDAVFWTKARALLAYKRGDIAQGLAVYDRNFQPLWPDELIKNYFDLLSETNNLRSFLQQAHKALEQNPDDFNAAARIYYYYSHTGNLDAAEQALTDYRVKKESRGASWTAQELYIFAKLLENSRRYPEAARYYFALYNSGDQKSAEQALVGLANIMLNAPEQQIRFGAADLSMYRNIATMDSGPGYLNGILSLILNDVGTDEEYVKEQGRAVAYFHRSKAAALVALLDQRFPNSDARADLHARLIDAYDSYGEQDAVLRLGNEFLAAFPQAEQRTKISLLMANVYAVRKDSKDEFALYDTLLKELAAKAEGVPMGEDIAGTARAQSEVALDEYHDQVGNNTSAQDDRDAQNDDEKKPEKQAFALSTQASVRARGARSPEYEHVLDEYLSRLAQQNAIPQALQILRRELDRNPDDPGLYERCARFLEQNGLGTELETVYKKAIQKFPGTSWYQKLARWYLRHDRESDFQQLTSQVADIFSGTELQAYFQQIWVPSSLSIAIERYAHQRFPHNLEFVRDLLGQYRSHGQMTEWEALLRQYWFEDEWLRNMFFEYLSRTGRLNAELEQLEKQEYVGQSTWPDVARANPVAARFVAEAELWKSHFEKAASPLGAVASLYPADVSIGRETSSVYRSLAYFKPINTTRAVRIELNLLRANPLNRDTLARIGDIYSDRSQFSLAAPYWNRMPLTEPGNPASYEEAATVFWDYYMFDDALRLLEKGRAQLNDATLYSYQAGAIYENKRDYARAVAEYVKGALERGEQSPAYSRLLQLAPRRSASAYVDAVTAKAVAESGFAFPAIQLRADVLRAQFRTPEIATFLDSLVQRVDSAETLEQMDKLALQRALNLVHCHILEREAALNSDPVRKMQLQYELASFYESQKDLPAAQQNMESLYQQNPRILGVIRTTVDFYWRNKEPRKAIAVLQKAAADAYPELRNKFNYEAARKMTEAGEPEQARKILSALLEQSAFNADYLAAIADTYAHAGDNAGLRHFYVTQIAEFRHADLPAAERKARIAELRRGLVPALTALKDYSGAVDQYIELINAYPEDESISSEAALYALRHGGTARIVNFYKKTVVESPQDPRWAVVLARLQTATEDYPAAIQAYSQAINVRPDRPDLLAARAGLEERLLHLDEAAADYTTLYDRTYHDPAWMVKEAEVRARQNKPELAVKALEAAYVDGRPKSASAYYAVAEHLESWGLLTQARLESEKGVDAAGNDLLAAWENHSLARLYVRLMTRLRMQEAAFARLERAIHDANTLPLWHRDAEQKGTDEVAEKEWQKSTLDRRTNAARSGMVDCMEEMGSTVSRYFTPEQKQQFLGFVEKKNTEMGRLEAHSYLLPLSQKAEFAELQVKLMVEALQGNPQVYGTYSPYARQASLNRLTDLQIRRLRLVELGRQLEQTASLRNGSNDCTSTMADCLGRAADIYHLAGKPEDELRTLDKVSEWKALNSQQRERYFELLLASNPQKLVELAGHNDDQGNEGAEFLLAHGQARLVQQAIDARRNQTPVWRHAYTALAGLYFNDSSPRTKSAFLAALDDQSIGQRLKTGGDRDQALAGEEWFYYASRYGEFMELSGGRDAEDFLTGELEHTPNDADAYFDIASTYQDYADWPHAVEDYQHVLELSPGRVDAHERLAEIYWKQQKKEAAVQELKLAVEALKNKVRSERGLLNGRDYQGFKDDFVDVAEQAKAMAMQQEFAADLKGILHNYVRFNGNRYVWAMIPAALGDPRNPREVTTFILELSRSSAVPNGLLEYFAQADHGLKLEREPILRRLVEILREQARNRPSDEPDYGESERQGWEIKWMESLLQVKQYDRLREELRTAAKSLSDENRASLLSIQLRLGAATGKLESALAAYLSDESQAPSSENLRTAAQQIQELGDKQTAQKILEFVYQREIDQHQFSVAGMTGLAEIRIDAGDLPAGLELLRRMTLVAGAPFEAQDPAAELLMRKGHAAEAITFLEELVKAMPWNAEYRVRLAQARLAAGRDVELARKELVAVAQDAKAPYEVRVTAAGALAGSSKTDLGSRELNLIAAGSTTPAEANQTFFFAARLNAAAHSDTASRITLLRAALEDYPSADNARLPLLQAAMKSGDFHLAIATMKPFLRNHWLDLNSSTDFWYQPDYDDSEGDDDATAADDGTVSDDAIAADAEFTPWLSLKNSDKAEICELVGRAFQRLSALDDAISFFKQAVSFHPSSTVDKRLKAEVREVRKMLAEQREDRQRQPAFGQDVNQAQVVRPKIPLIKPKGGAADVQGGHR